MFFEKQNSSLHWGLSRKKKFEKTLVFSQNGHFFHILASFHLQYPKWGFFLRILT